MEYVAAILQSKVGTIQIYKHSVSSVNRSTHNMGRNDPSRRHHEQLAEKAQL